MMPNRLSKCYLGLIKSVKKLIENSINQRKYILPSQPAYLLIYQWLIKIDLRID